MFKYTIVVPNYNKGEYLETCLDSLVNQTYKNTEIVVIDDASTDNSLEIINKFKDRRNVKIFTHARNMGKSYTFNEGFMKAEGDYVSLLGSDDLLVETAIETIDDHLSDSSNPIDMIFSNIFLLNNEDNTICDGKIAGTFSKYLKPYHFLFGCKVTSICTFYSKKLIRSTSRFDDSLNTRGQDYDYFIRALDYGNYLPIDQPLGYYRRGTNNSIYEGFTNNFIAIAIKNKSIFLKYIDEQFYNQILSFGLETLETNEIDRGFFAKVSLLGTLLFLKMKNKRVSIYGIGELGKKALDFIKSLGVNLVNVYDSYSFGQKVFDQVVVEPRSISVAKDEFIIICSTIGKEEISVFLDKQGLEHGKDYLFYHDYDIADCYL